MSLKFVTLGLLKIKVFWNKSDDDIIFPHDVTNKILSRDSNYIVDVVMWRKFGNFSYYNLNFIRIWPKKQISLKGALDSRSIIWDGH